MDTRVTESPYLEGYRVILRRAFAMIALGPKATQREAETTIQELLCREVEAGSHARAVLDEEKRRWQEQTGKCAMCGGEPHD